MAARGPRVAAVHVGALCAEAAIVGQSLSQGFTEKHEINPMRKPHQND